jgi:hypothetical protein
VDWSGINIFRFGTWDVSVSGAVGISSVGTVCTIDTYATFPFTDCPSNGIDHQAVDEIQQGTGQMNVEGLFLLGGFMLEYPVFFLVATSGLGYGRLR